MSTKTKEVYALDATTRDEIIFELRTKFDLTGKEAVAYYNANYKGTRGLSTVGKFDEILLTSNPSEKEIKDFLLSEGANVTSALSFYKSRAKLALDIKASIKAKAK